VFLGDEEMAVITRTGVEFTDFFGRPVSEGDAAGPLGPDHGGEGRLQALHAQGDLRAADAARENDPRARLAGLRQGVPRGDEDHDAQFAAVETVTISRAARRGTRRWSASS
jgi:hypothetical protein